MLMKIGKTKIKMEFGWSKDKTWWITGKDGYRNHILFGASHNNDIGYDLQMLTFYFFKLNLNICWGTGTAIDIEDPTLHS